MKKILQAAMAFALLLTQRHAQAQDEPAAWPKEFNSSQGKVVLYQPQPQKLDGNKVIGVSAFSLTPSGKKDPVFGALFFEARMAIDRDDRTYAMESLAIPNIKFTGEQKELDPEKVKAALIQEAKGWKVQGSLDQLMTTIEANADELTKAKQAFNNDPPKIVYADKPSVLILIDGDPKMQDIKNTQLQHIANSPYTIFLNKPDRQYYLYGGQVWYAAASLQGPWRVTKNVPKDINKLLESNKEAAKSAPKVVTDKDTIPDVIISTVPAELIVTVGQPQYKDIDSTNLQYASNSDDNLFREKGNGKLWILKSGRWFTSASLQGTWKYVPAEEILKDFGNIPRGTEKDNVLASVPGTIEARDALLDAQLPQTATVDRATAGKDAKVQYDGKPQYEKIPGTTLELVQNSDKTVFRTYQLPTTAGSSKQFADKPVYYMVDNGVWYTSFAPDGPWRVSDTRPPDVDNIPPTSSAYNTKYVYVYDQTPSTVYVGYTPGYMGSYIYGPTVVYGTGWYYRPWYGSYYYPHHATWGFNMGYNPWTGWSIGFGFTSGPFHFGFGTGGFTFGMSWGIGVPMWGYPGYGGGWFGPPMYRPPCYGPHYPYYGYNRPGYNGGYRPGYGNRPPNIGQGNGNVNWGGGNQINVGGDVNINIGNGSGNNLYNRPGNNGGNRPGISSGINGGNAGNLNINNRPNRPNGNGNNAGNGNRPGNNNNAGARPNPGFGNNGNNGNSRPNDNSRPTNNNNNGFNNNGARPNDNGRPGNNNNGFNNNNNGTRPAPSNRPANDVFADRDGNVYQKDKVNGGFNQNTGGNNWNRPANNNNGFNNGGFNGGGNARPAPDYNRDRGNNKAGQINRVPPTNNFGGNGGGFNRPSPGGGGRPAPQAAPRGRGRG